MDYVRLWTTFHDDAKVQRLSDKAFRYYVNCLSWCGRHETDGVYEAVGKPPRMVAELIERGFFVPLDEDGTFFINGWDKRQVSTERLEEVRRHARERQAKWRSVTRDKPRDERVTHATEVEVEVEVEKTSSRDTSPEAMRLCALLARLVEANGSKRPTVTRRWLDEADRMLRLDHRPIAEAEALVRWSQDDAFWKANVMSMVKFRAQYDTLRLQRERVTGNGNGHDPAFDIPPPVGVDG